MPRPSRRFLNTTDTTRNTGSQQSPRDTLTHLLDARKIPFEITGDGLTVKTHLNLEGEDVFVLPDHLTVQGTLNLGYCAIEQLPEHLVVQKQLYANHTRITCLPDTLSVGGDVALMGSPITHLPEAFASVGWLNLVDTQITSLPEGLRVGGTLSLSGTRLLRLPKILHVEGVIMPPEGLAEVNAFMETVPGDLFVLHADSSHAQMSLFARLQDFPDLRRIAASLGRDHRLSILRVGASQYSLKLRPAQ